MFGRASIGAREVPVFLALPEALASATAPAILAPEDLARVGRLRFESDREIAFASRVLQRRALSSCAPVALDAWRFVDTEHGRPIIVAPELTPQLHFSVANTRGLVACAVSQTPEIGLDVERWRDVVSPGLIARCLTDHEREALSTLPSADQPRRFVVLWTAKEAYIKARGLGLSIPLQRIDVRLDGNDSPRLTLHPALADDGSSWQLASWSPTPSHAASVCVRKGQGPPFTIVPHWIEGDRPA